MAQALGSLIVIRRLAQILSSLLPAVLALGAAGGLRAQTSESPPVTAQAYIYVEPYQTRFEFMLDLRTAMRWLEVGDYTVAQLPPGQSDTLLAKASTLAQTWYEVSVDGSTPSLAPPTAHIVRGKPGQTLPLDPAAPIVVADCMLGLIWQVPTGPQPQQLNSTFRWADTNLKTVPVTLFFGKTIDHGELLSVSPSILWQNEGRLPAPLPLAKVPEIRLPAKIKVPVGAIFWGLGGLIFYIVIRIKDYRLPGGSLPYLGVWALGALLFLPLLVVRFDNPFEKQPDPVSTPDQAQEIVEKLIHNVYRAFDQRTESDVYDRLKLSADGELLRQLYLDTIQSLNLDDKESARVSISQFSASVDAVEPGTLPHEFIATTSWGAIGSVGHWGHTHPRTVTCTAKIQVTPIEGQWKITHIEVLEQRRL